MSYCDVVIKKKKTLQDGYKYFNSTTDMWILVCKSSPYKWKIHSQISIQRVFDPVSCNAVQVDLLPIFWDSILVQYSKISCHFMMGPISCPEMLVMD